MHAGSWGTDICAKIHFLNIVDANVISIAAEVEQLLQHTVHPQKIGSLVSIAATLNTRHGKSACSLAAPIKSLPDTNHDPCCYRLRASSLAEARDAELQRMLAINAQLRQDLATLQSPHVVSTLIVHLVFFSCDCHYKRPYVASLAAYMHQWNTVALAWCTAMSTELSTCHCTNNCKCYV